MDFVVFVRIGILDRFGRDIVLDLMGIETVGGGVWWKWICSLRLFGCLMLENVGEIDFRLVFIGMWELKGIFQGLRIMRKVPRVDKRW
ncbi:hypothetical protein P7C65_06s1g08280 [Encephalitozoon intestinalis]